MRRIRLLPLNYARFYFLRKTGYMSPYKWRDVLYTYKRDRERGFNTDPLYVRIGWSAFRVRKRKVIEYEV